jgi:hypothetical protein
VLKLSSSHRARSISLQRNRPQIKPQPKPTLLLPRCCHFQLRKNLKRPRAHARGFDVGQLCSCARLLRGDVEQRGRLAQAANLPQFLRQGRLIGSGWFLQGLGSGLHGGGAPCWSMRRGQASGARQRERKICGTGGELQLQQQNRITVVAAKCIVYICAYISRRCEADKMSVLVTSGCFKGFSKATWSSTPPLLLTVANASNAVSEMSVCLNASAPFKRMRATSRDTFPGKNQSVTCRG